MLFFCAILRGFVLINNKQTWCLTSTETIRLIRDGEKGGRGLWRWGKKEMTDIPLATLSPPVMTPALRWAATRAILMFH